jgi:hypothetical protein
MIASQVSQLKKSMVAQQQRTTTWQERFLELLPRIRAQSQRRFRYLPYEAREDAIAEVIASSLVSYARLVSLGQEDRAFATVLVRFAAAQFHAGRRVGSRLNGHDVTSGYCQQKKGVLVERLDRFDEQLGDWKELIVQDRHSTPAEVAATRVDFATWLAQLARRTRQIARDLARGYSTSEVACKYGITAGRISQLRRELEASWAEFQHEGFARTP